MNSEIMSLEIIKSLCIKHAKKIIKEAKEWRKRGVEANFWSKVIKKKWEKELYLQLSKIFKKKLSLIGKNSGYIKEDAELILLLDLFDGSLNFLLGGKYFAYNVAIMDQKGILFGLCIDLENFDCYSAYRGQGAYLNNKKLKGPLPFCDRIICTNVIIKNVPFLHFGCSSLELCLLAKGAADIVVGKSKLSDISAAMLIALEAGATITNWQYKKFEIPINNISNDTTLEYIAGNERAIEKFFNKFQNLNNIVIPMRSVWPIFLKRGKIGINYS